MSTNKTTIITGVPKGLVSSWSGIGITPDAKKDEIAIDMIPYLLCTKTPSAKKFSLSSTDIIYVV